MSSETMTRTEGMDDSDVPSVDIDKAECGSDIDDYLSQSPTIIPASELPAGWVCIKYNDGSGYLRSPEGKTYFSYDMQTGEYDEYDDRHWSFWAIPMNFSNFAEFAERKMLRKL